MRLPPPIHIHLLATACFVCGFGDSWSDSARADEQRPRQPIELSLAAETTPVKCRAVRLQPTTAELDRTVVTAVAADPQGEFVAVAGDDHAIRILRTETMSVVQVLRGHRDMIRTLTFDPRGKKLVSAGNDGQLIVWNRDDSFRIIQRMSDTPALVCVRFAADGTEMAAVGFDNAVYIIGGKNRQRPVFHCDCRDLRCVEYRDDSKLLAVAGRSGNLHLFDPATGRLIGEHTLHRGRVRAMSFHRDSNTVVTVGEDGELVVFDTQNQKELRRVKVTSGKLFSVTTIDSQHVAVAGADNIVRIVNTDDAVVTQQLSGHQGSIPTLCASGGSLFSGGFDATLRRWSLGDAGSHQERIAESESRIDR
tara:strand:+ start:62519 stop:63610 length:1092 start_codon:yes stop_codon:yes gene_type:complete